MGLSVALALVAACINAVSNNLQRITNRDEQNVQTLSLRLVRDLLHRPLWFAAIGAITVSFLLQATALRFGPLSLVEPVLICELPLTFVGAIFFLRAPLGRREWLAAIIMTAGLGVLLGFLRPSGPVHSSVPTVTWVLGIVASEGAVAALVVAGRRSERDVRAAFYGAATGIQFGTTAALMKGAVAFVSAPATLFTSWQLYAMVASGVWGLFLLQNAMQAGKLLAAQPGITLLDPVVAMLWGIVGFGERTASDPLTLGLAVVGGAAMVAGAVLLSRSPMLERIQPGAGCHGAGPVVAPAPASPTGRAPSSPPAPSGRSIRSEARRRNRTLLT